MYIYIYTDPNIDPTSTPNGPQIQAKIERRSTQHRLYFLPRSPSPSLPTPAEIGDFPLVTFGGAGEAESPN